MLQENTSTPALHEMQGWGANNWHTTTPCRRRLLLPQHMNAELGCRQDLLSNGYGGAGVQGQLAAKHQGLASRQRHEHDQLILQPAASDSRTATDSGRATRRAAADTA